MTRSTQPGPEYGTESGPRAGRDDAEYGEAPVRRTASGLLTELRCGSASALIASVGATLVRFRASGRDLVVPFDPDLPRPANRGMTLAPWPNRVADGRYSFGEAGPQQLPVDEVERGHALHGLAGWLDWSVVARERAAVELRTEIVPQQGYPWRLALRTRYRLDERGLAQTVSCRNLSPTTAPFGTGPHPYLTAPRGALDDWRLTLPASRTALVDDRLLPTSVLPVDDPRAHREVGASPDFRSARRIGATKLDHAFTDLHRDPDGLARVRLADADGRGVEMSWDARCPWVQIHTADLPGLAGTPADRIGLAVEPMTCPPDAFNSGRDLIELRPGGTATASWLISPIGA